MKIGVFFTYDYSLQGWSSSGVLNRELAIYEKLSKDFDVEFSLFTYGDESDLELNINNKFNIVPLYLSTKKNPNKYLRFINSFFLPFKIRKELKDIDILHQHQLNGVWLPIICKILFRKKLLVRTGYDMHYFSIRDKKKLLIKTFYKFLTFISVKFSDIYTVTSKVDEQRILSKYKKISNKLKIRPNWVQKVDLRKNETRNNYRILSVGRLVYQKNFIQMLSEFKNTKNEYQIDIIGEGDEKNNLLKLADDLNVNLNIMDNCTNEELLKIYKNYKYYISFSIFEGNPKTVLESMASGCIPICSNIPSHSEIIKNKVDGLLFELEEPKILNKIKDLNQNDSLAKSLSNKSIDRVRKNNSIELLSSLMYEDYRLLNY